MLGCLANYNFFGHCFRLIYTKKTWLKFCRTFNIFSTLVNDFRKLINVIVIIISGLVATFGYNYIPFKAYAIIAGLTGLLTAMILTKTIKTK